MSPPDATIALLSGAAGVTGVFSVPPFQQQQLEKPGIKTIGTIYNYYQNKGDILGATTVT